MPPWPGKQYAKFRFYSYHQKIKPKLNGKLNGFLARYFLGGFENRQSVTNPNRIVSQILAQAIPQYVNGNAIKIIPYKVKQTNTRA